MAASGVESLGDYGVEVKEGKLVRHKGSAYVELEHGTHYTLTLINNDSRRCCVDVNIDDIHVGKWVIHEHSSGSVERPTNEEKKFTFFLSKHAPETSGIVSGKSTNGLVSCTFIRGKEKGLCLTVQDVDGDSHSLSYEGTSTRSALHKKGCQIVGFKTEEGEGVYCKSMVMTDSFKVYLLSGSDTNHMHDQSPIALFARDLSGVTHTLTVPTYAKGSDLKNKVSQLIRCDKQNFQMMYIMGEQPDNFGKSGIYDAALWNKRTVFIEYRSTLSFYVKNKSGRPKLLDLASCARGIDLRKKASNIVGYKVDKEQGYSLICKGKKIEDDFELATLPDRCAVHVHNGPYGHATYGSPATVIIATLTGKKIIVDLPPNADVSDIKDAIEDKEGTPTDMMRLTWTGIPLDETFDLSLVEEGARINLSLSLRGGGGCTIHGSGCRPELHEEASLLHDKAADPSANWAAGGTTLQGKSHQKFKSTTFVGDEKAQPVCINIRLVGLKELNINSSQYKNLKCTPLSNSVPPPIDD